MKKLLSCAPYSALIIFMFIPLCHGMNAEQSTQGHKRLIQPECEIFDTKCFLPSELWHKIFLYAQRGNISFLYIFQLVCKPWREMIQSNEFDVDLTPWDMELTDEILKQWPNCTNLNLEFSCLVTNDGLKGLTKLIFLDLSENDNITDDGIRGLTNLVVLNLLESSEITNDGIMNLTNLTDLVLCKNDQITDEEIINLTNLTNLRLIGMEQLTDDLIKTLTNLTQLSLANNNTITNNGISDLTKLTILGLDENDKIIDENIWLLTNLTDLSLSYNNTITNDGLKDLTNLKYLELEENETISDQGIRGLTNLTYLCLNNNKTITNNGIKNLTKLKYLYLQENQKITDEGIVSCTDLIELDLSKNINITIDGIKNLKKMDSDINIFISLINKVKGLTKYNCKTVYALDQVYCNVQGLLSMHSVLLKFPQYLNSNIHDSKDIFRNLYFKFKKELNLLLEYVDVHVNCKVLPAVKDQKETPNTVNDLRQLIVKEHKESSTAYLESKILCSLDSVKNSYLLLMNFYIHTNNSDYDNYKTSRQYLDESISEIYSRWNNFLNSDVNNEADSSDDEF